MANCATLLQILRPGTCGLSLLSSGQPGSRSLMAMVYPINRIPSCGLYSRTAVLDHEGAMHGPIRVSYHTIVVQPAKPNTNTVRAGNNRRTQDG